MIPRTEVILLPRIRAAIISLALAAHVVLLAWIGATHFPVIDEMAHLPAGVSHWKQGTFELYRVNPPLVRMIGSLPVALFGPSDIGVASGPSDRPEFVIGRNLVNVYGWESVKYFTWARWMLIPISVLGAAICYRWASELHGPTAGMISLLMWSFCPTVISNGATIMPDMGAAALGAAASYSYWRFLERPSWERTLVSGLLLGLAFLSKLTWIALFVLWPILAALRLITVSSSKDLRAGRLGVQTAAVLGLGLLALNAGYGFEGFGKPLGQHNFASGALGGSSASITHRANRFAGTLPGRLPTVLPENYVLGVDYLKWEFETKMPSYLRGNWRLGGWWYYYLYGMLVKMPVGYLVLIAASLATIAKDGYVAFAERAAGNSWRLPLRVQRDLCLLLPAVLVIVLVSSQTGFNHHLRYVLPAFPFLFVACGRVGPWVEASRKALTFVAAALLWAIVSSLLTSPHQHSFFNELAGGGRRGDWHLTGSNLDWGQDITYLERWSRTLPESEPLWVCLHTIADPQRLGFRPLPYAVEENDDSAESKPIGSHSAIRLVPGWYAISRTRLVWSNGAKDAGSKLAVNPWSVDLTPFESMSPIAVLGNSINIYRIDSTDRQSPD